MLTSFFSPTLNLHWYQNHHIFSMCPLIFFISCFVKPIIHINFMLTIQSHILSHMLSISHEGIIVYCSFVPNCTFWTHFIINHHIVNKYKNAVFMWITCNLPPPKKKRKKRSSAHMTIMFVNLIFAKLYIMATF